MEKININTSTDNTTRGNVFEEAVTLENKVKKKITKGFANYAGIFVGVFLMFAVIVIVTTDITLTSFEQVAALGLDFFLLLFCSYSMYINCSDSGMRAGLVNKSYVDALAVFEEHKKSIVERRMQVRLSEFCRHYIEEELKNSRMDILAIVGLSYDTYTKEYMSKDKSDILKSELSTVQKEAIIKANAITPVKLTPEMIMKRGRGSNRSSPLGVKPETKKMLNFGGKFVTTFLVSLMMVVMVFNVVVEPTWAIVASCVLKLLAVAINGFGGYKFGFENIVFDTVNYINDQTDLMRQAIQYIEDTPAKKDAPPQLDKPALSDTEGAPQSKELE